MIWVIRARVTWPSQFGVVCHGAGPNELLEPDDQRHQPGDVAHAPGSGHRLALPQLAPDGSDRVLALGDSRQEQLFLLWRSGAMCSTSMIFVRAAARAPGGPGPLLRWLCWQRLMDLVDFRGVS